MPKLTNKLFISHASEDKRTIVAPLVDALRRRGLTCWYDENEIEIGENIPKEIGRGLADSDYVVAILTPRFMAKTYTLEELSTALNQVGSTGRDKLLPVLVGTPEERAQIFQRIQNELPQLGKIKATEWGDGVAADAIADAICRRVNPAATKVSRVCFISSEYPPQVVGGLGVHVDQLTKALAAEQVEVDVVLPSSADLDGYRDPPAGVHLHPIPELYPSYDDPVSWLTFANFAADRVVNVLARRSRPEVIHCHDWVTALAGIKCRRLLDVPLVFHLHLPNRAPLSAPIENLGLISADLVTVNSDSMRVALKKRRLPRPSVEVEVIKNGVDIGNFVPWEGWPEDDGYVLFVGRLVQQKGVEHLLRAFYCVREKFPDVRLKIVGRGELDVMLKTLSDNLMLGEQVEWIDWQTGPGPVELYQKARVVVVPSIYEPFGMTALEAMACKRPVVASGVGGLNEIIKRGVTGFLAVKEDALDLAQRIMALLANADLRRRMGEAGLARVLEQGYTWPEVARGFVEQYERLRGQPIEKLRGERAFEFERQIREATMALKPSFPYNELNELFRWEN